MTKDRPLTTSSPGPDPPLPSCLKETPQGISLTILVRPKSRKTGWEEPKEAVLRLKVQSPPVHGAANQTCLAFLAGWFGLKKSEVVLLKGERSRQKVFLLKGLDLKKGLTLLPDRNRYQ